MSINITPKVTPELWVLAMFLTGMCPGVASGWYLECGNDEKVVYGGLHRKSWTSPNPISGRRPQLCRQGVIRDLSEESWRPGLSVQISVVLSHWLSTGLLREWFLELLNFCWVADRADRADFCRVTNSADSAEFGRYRLKIF